MTKKQKIWLWIFIAMFAVPEILWSPILTYILPFFLGSSYKFRDSIFFSGDVSPLLTTFIMFIQSIGIISATVNLCKREKKLRCKTVIVIIFSLVSLVSIVALYLQIMISKSDLLGL